MWGTPGTLVAARTMLDRTGDERWREAWQASADALWSRRDEEGRWTQRLHGEEYKGLGTRARAGRERAGAPATARRASAGGSSSERRARVLARAAFVEDGLANWAYIERPELPSAAGEIRLQWCAGAPGHRRRRGRLPRRGASARAAPSSSGRRDHRRLEKGAGICHGTAGNGYALLAAFGRTGDEQWLERARGVRRARARPGRAQCEAATRSGPAASASRSSPPTASRAKTRYPVPRLNPGLPRDSERLAVRRRGAPCRRRACARPRRAARRRRRTARPPRAGGGSPRPCGRARPRRGPARRRRTRRSSRSRPRPPRARPRAPPTAPHADRVPRRGRG